MIAVVQRVTRASVRVAGETVGAVGAGFLVLLGVAREDAEFDADWLADKVTSLRLFRDEEGRMNRTLDETDGALLVISQFTLLGDCLKGRRPSFVAAAEPERADALYRRFVARARSGGRRVETGVFQAMMEVELVNDGPVTLIVDSARARRGSTGPSSA